MIFLYDTDMVSFLFGIVETWTEYYRHRPDPTTTVATVAGVKWE